MAMKKQKITDAEFDTLVFEAGKVSRDNINFDRQMLAVEGVLRANPHLLPSPRLIILRGAQQRNKGKLKEAIALYRQGEQLAIAQKNTAMEALALRMLGAELLITGEVDEAERCLRKTIELSAAIGQPYQQAAALDTLSNIYLKYADFEKYLETSEEALSILKSAGVEPFVYARAYSSTMNARCVELLNLKLYDRAYEALQVIIHSPELALAGEYTRLSTMLTYGQYLCETEQYAQSIDVLQELLDQFKDEPVNEEIAAIHSYMAENMLALREYDKALSHLRMAEAYHRESNMIFFLCENLLCRASVLIGMGRSKPAAKCVKEAEAIMSETGSDFHQWQFKERCASFAARHGDYRRAYELLIEAKAYQASSLRRDYDKRIASINTRYELVEKERQNDLLKKDIDMKKQELLMASDFLNQKMELLKEMKTFMKNMRRENIQKNEIMKALDSKINAAINVEYDQQIIIEKMETVNNDYITRIRKTFPQLSGTEAKICSLLKNNFSNKEIANLLVTSLRTVENHRYRIRKKLNVTADDNLYRVLSTV